MPFRRAEQRDRALRLDQRAGKIGQAGHPVGR
jgi:hypothetical protein